MKNKKIIIFLYLLVAVSFVINSCKKTSTAASIQSLFTNGTWQLASVMRYDYVGSSQVNLDTLNTTCNQTQYFTFPDNNTCTFAGIDDKTYSYQQI